MRILIYIFMIVSLSSFALQPETDFKVKEQKSRIEMNTPHGLKLYQGNFPLDSLRNYKIKIPLSDLIIKPVATPSATPEQRIASVEPAATPSPSPQASTTPVPSCSPTPVAKTTPEITPIEAPGQKREPASLPPAAPKESPKSLLEDEVDDTLPYDDSGRLLVEANRLYNRKEYYRALNVVEEVLRKRPSLTRAQVMYGSLLYILGQKELARETWQAAQKQDPENIWIKDILKQYP